MTYTNYPSASAWEAARQAAMVQQRQQGAIIAHQQQPAAYTNNNRYSSVPQQAHPQSVPAAASSLAAAARNLATMSRESTSTGAGTNHRRKKTSPPAAAPAPRPAAPPAAMTVSNWREQQQQQPQSNEPPVAVQVTILPPVTSQNLKSPVDGEFLTSTVNRYNSRNGREQTVAEFVKFLVEVAGAEQWLLQICNRANSNVVKLCYGDGYETIFLIGADADVNATPRKLGVGMSVNTSEASVETIARSWLLGSDSIWSHVKAFQQAQELLGGQLCVYIRTGNRNFMVPSNLSETELKKRRRMIRVYPDPENPDVVLRMEEASGAAKRLQQLNASAVNLATGSTNSGGATQRGLEQLQQRQQQRGSNTSTFGENGGAARRLQELQQQTNMSTGHSQPNGNETAGLNANMSIVHANDAVEALNMLQTKRKATDESKAQDGNMTNAASQPKKKRAKRDSNKPKLAQSARNFYLKEMRGSIRENNPDITAGEEVGIIM